MSRVLPCPSISRGIEVAELSLDRKTGHMVDWALDEHANAGVEHVDPSYVAGYERKAGFDPTEDIDVLTRHGLDGGSVVVDMGAGTGVFAAAVARHCGRVIAVDISPAMTSALRQKRNAQHLDNLTIVQAGFLSYDHQGSPADVVYSRNALHQLPDFWKGIALTRVASILRPGGLLRLRDLVFDFEPSQAAVKIPEWLAGAVSEPHLGFTAEELAIHVKTEFSTYSWLLESMLERTGFQILHRAYRRSAYGAYTCIRI